MLYNLNHDIESTFLKHLKHFKCLSALLQVFLFPHVVVVSPISIHKVTSQGKRPHFQSHGILGGLIAIPFSTSDVVKGITCKVLLSWQVWSCCWHRRKRLPKRLKPTFYQRKQPWKIWTIVSWIMAGWDTLLNHLIPLIPAYFSFCISTCSYKACIKPPNPAAIRTACSTDRLHCELWKDGKNEGTGTTTVREAQHLDTCTFFLSVSSLLNSWSQFVSSVY